MHVMGKWPMVLYNIPFLLIWINLFVDILGVVHTLNKCYGRDGRHLESYRMYTDIDEYCSIDQDSCMTM